MGRSQIKYRATHGRGRGRGKHEATRGHSETEENSKISHLRYLGSNAYRFKEQEETDEIEEAAQINDHNNRTQYFASEQNYRDDIGPTSGEYFQSRTMKQWEEVDDVETDIGEAFGMLDLNLIASQLKLVSPDNRYRMDPQYCIDFPFKPLRTDVKKEDMEGHDDITSNIVTGACPTPTQSINKGDAELNSLLKLSKSSLNENNLAHTLPVAQHVPPEASIETELLEDWLDDVLNI
ncbi:hypothetical protein Plhal304r1_c007g0029551 [Plasmopara halstedii]